jgi:hypothetical protein
MGETLEPTTVLELSTTNACAVRKIKATPSTARNQIRNRSRGDWGSANQPIRENGHESANLEP